MTNVIKLDFITKNLDASEILKEIAKENPKHCFVITWPEDGSMPCYHSSCSDMPTVLLRVNGFVHKFYNGDFDE